MPGAAVGAEDEVELAVGDVIERCNRARGPGAHQFRSPRSRIVAGTTNARTSVASIATAMAIPRPIALIRTMSAVANAAKTPTMIAAAPVMSRPLRSRPIATAWVLSRSLKYSSWIRERSSTS